MKYEDRKKNLLCFSASLLLCFSLALSNLAKETKKNEKKEEVKKEIKINESEYEPILLGTLLDNPQNYLEKKIRFRGKFSSFTTLALDYEPALRKSKDYISLCIFRPDSKIPLSELKLAYPLKEAKENEVIRELEEEDLLEIYGKVFSAALDEPWIDVLYLKNLKSTNKKNEKLAEVKTETKEEKSDKNIKQNKKLKDNNE